MPARKFRGTLDKPWDEGVRLKIKTSMLINRLQDFVEAKVSMEAHQVTAALGLLKKTLPDLQATTIKGDAENPVKLEITWAKPSE